MKEEKEEKKSEKLETNQKALKAKHQLINNI